VERAREATPRAAVVMVTAVRENMVAHVKVGWKVRGWARAFFLQTRASKVFKFLFDPPFCDVCTFAGPGAAPAKKLTSLLTLKA
jgi:hypothetical protein